MFVYTIFTYTYTLGKAISFWLLGIPQMQVIVRGSPQDVPNNSGFLNYSTYYLHRIYIYRYMYMYVKNRTIYYTNIYTPCDHILRIHQKIWPPPKRFSLFQAFQRIPPPTVCNRYGGSLTRKTRYLCCVVPQVRSSTSRHGNSQKGPGTLPGDRKAAEVK